MKTTPTQRKQMKEWRERHPGAWSRWSKENASYKERKRARDSIRQGDRRGSKVNKRDGVLMVVYVIEAGPYTKVGIAEDIVTRLRTFKTHCPLPVRLAFCSKQMFRPEARALELECHSHIIENHVHGEWFEVDSKTVVSFIEKICVAAPDVCGPQLRLVI